MIPEWTSKQKQSFTTRDGYEVEIISWFYEQREMSTVVISSLKKVLSLLAVAVILSSDIPLQTAGQTSAPLCVGVYCIPQEGK